MLSTREHFDSAPQRKLLHEMEKLGMVVYWEHAMAYVNVQGSEAAKGVVFEGMCANQLWPRADSPQARWHARRRGGSAALRWLGLPVRWLAWWGCWLCESVAAQWGKAPDDVVVDDNVVLPWPGKAGGMEWELKVVTLRDIFPGELLALCVLDTDVGPDGKFGGGPVRGVADGSPGKTTGVVRKTCKARHGGLRGGRCVWRH